MRTVSLSTRNDLDSFWVKAHDMAGIVAHARLRELRHAHASHSSRNAPSLQPTDVARRLFGQRRAFTANRNLHLHDSILNESVERVSAAIQRRLAAAAMNGARSNRKRL